MNRKIAGLWVFVILAIGVMPYSAQRAGGSGSGGELKPTVILISIDGFRADYLDRYPAPALSRLAGQGVRAKWMTPVYPSLTFPNHYSIATGLYPEHHGIVSNNFYDPEFKQSVSIGQREEMRNGRWWLGEPIWVTAERQGQRAAAFFFPGTEAEIGGRRPSYWKTYDEKIPNAERVDTVLSWLELAEPERPTMILTYFSDVDHAGHEAGPDSEAVRQAVATVDQAVGRLVEGLKSRGLLERVNLVIVSDHGMARVDTGRVVLLDDYFDPQQAETVVWSGTFVNIFPKPGMEQSIYDRLKSKSPPHVSVYRKAEIPERFHYRASRRIGEIVVRAEEGWTISRQDRDRPSMQTRTAGAIYHGVHGYDNRLKSMRAIFIAHGPAFKSPLTIEPFANVDVYHILTGILGLKPAPNDGGTATARAVLRLPR